MPTIFTHAAVPLALGLGLGRKAVSGKLLAAIVAAGMLPDIDGVGYRLGIPFSGLLGHRGVTHSLLAAAAVAACAGIARCLDAKRLTAMLLVFAAMASHGPLDMLTSGGPGVMLFWPFSNERLFFPWRGIRVSPMTLGPLLSQRGLAVVLSELVWVWLPCAVAMTMLILFRRLSGFSSSARNNRGGDE